MKELSLVFSKKILDDKFNFVLQDDAKRNDLPFVQQSFERSNPQVVQ